MRTNKLAIALTIVGCIFISYFIISTIYRLKSQKNDHVVIINVLEEQVKQDSIKAVGLRQLADSLQQVALEYQAKATIEHQARLDLLAKQRKDENKKILAATARQAVQYFVASVDTGTKAAPDLIAVQGDTLAQISYMTIRKANVLFSELEYSRQAIVEHNQFEDDLVMIINDINESANTYKAEADTWKQSTDDLKTINKHMQAINNEDKKKLKRSRTLTKILTGALVLTSAKIIFF